MKDRLTVTLEEKPIYNIIVNKSYEKLIDSMNELKLSNRKICIVSDSMVSSYYLEEVCCLFKPYVKQVNSFVFEAGEKNKNLDTVKRLYEFLIVERYDRNDMLAALGGGVTGDLAGFCAATYLRGIRFMQLPTSLLSMVDSSIGGKTGVDFDSYKNMVGAFHQPKLVYINLATLNTLNKQEYYSGFGEIIKHGLIKDNQYFNYIKENIKGLKERDINSLKEVIFGSCMIKKSVVENDAMELGERALLNFGHTIGHGVEKLTDFKMLHGECVAVGMAASAFISKKRNYITEEEFEDILSVLKAFELPVKVLNLRKEEILEATKHDKKMESGKINFILLEKIGKAVIVKNVTDEEMLLAIDYITN